MTTVRRLVVASLVAALVIALVSCAVVDKTGPSPAGRRTAGPQVEFVKAERKIDVMIAGRLFTSYLYGGEPYELVEGADKHDGGFLTKPVLFPVRTPSGIVVTRGYPLEKVQGESIDHPHHVGVSFTYDKVNDDGFWGNTTAPPLIKHIKVTKMKGGSGRGVLSTVMHWIGKAGEVLLEEKRKMTFYAGQDEYIIDFSIDLTAQDTRVVFSDTKEGMFAIRVAEWLREKGGTASYLSSNGDQPEKNVWGRRARWVRLQGEKDGKTIGVAILNHPASVNYPTYWHARGYGLFSANPLGQYVYQKSRGEKNPQRLNLTLEPGKTAHFGFRMIIYEGRKTKEQLDKQFDRFSSSATAK